MLRVYYASGRMKRASCLTASYNNLTFVHSEMNPLGIRKIYRAIEKNKYEIE